jgi:hypothetical protein
VEIAEGAGYAGVVVGDEVLPGFCGYVVHRVSGSVVSE